MPIHFEDQDVVSEAAGLRSALIVPCNLCPAVTVATRQNRPFMRFFRSPVKSAPFEEYLKAMQSRLDEKGVRSKVFRSSIYHQWFMCMWTERRRKKLAREAQDYDAVVVLGCDSATETVREVVAYGVGECERSRISAGLLRRGDLEGFGQLMYLSHDGDRVAGPCASAEPIAAVTADMDGQWHRLVGAYGCSTPKIDRLVDLARSVPGVWGAQIAGAGLGGCVMILAEASVIPRLKRVLTDRYYERLEIPPALWEVRSVAGGGVIRV